MLAGAAFDPDPSLDCTDEEDALFARSPIFSRGALFARSQLSFFVRSSHFTTSPLKGNDSKATPHDNMMPFTYSQQHQDDEG